jgi:hypothetical protein
MINKYLFKIEGMIKSAVVASSVKAYRRALELAQSGSHDFHGTSIHNLPSILSKKTLQIGKGGRDVHGKGVYFGRGRPVVGSEPSGVTSQIAVPKSENRKIIPDAGLVGEDFALDTKQVRLQGKTKTYVTLPPQQDTTAGVKEILHQARNARVRVLPNNVFHAAFSKVEGYDTFGNSKATSLGTRLAELRMRKQLIDRSLLKK